jgi:peptidoglycan/LPS O-acetylase OafA/YrhL
MFSRLSGFLTRHFSRRTTSGRFIAEVDGLRFFAIALVVVFHVYRYVWERVGGGSPAIQALEIGQYGVHLFFGISGFVLAVPFVRQRIGTGPRVDLKRYYLRRLKRIEPPYLVALTLFFLIFLLLRKAQVADYFAGLIYSHVTLLHSFNPLMPASWSLEIEVQFYLLMPVIALALWPRRSAARVAAIVALAAAAIWWRSGSVHETPWLLDWIELFLAGFLFAEMYVAWWNENVARRFVWDLATVAGIVLFAMHYLAIAILLLFAGAFGGRLTKPFVTNSILTTIGGMCYSIYLLHQMLISAIVKLTLPFFPISSGAQIVVQSILVIPIVLLLSAIFFYCVERPCMREDWPSRARMALAMLFARISLASSP